MVYDDLPRDAGSAVRRDFDGADAVGSGLAPRYAPARVDEKAALRALRIGNAVDGAALGRGGLDLCAVGERDGVVAGLRALARLVVGHRPGNGLRRKGKDPHVAEIGTSGAVEMGLRKAVDRLVFVAVAGAVVPVSVARVGAGLDEAEGNAGGGKCMARAGGSDERVDVVAAPCGVRGQDAERKQTPNGAQERRGHFSVFHVVVTSWCFCRYACGESPVTDLNTARESAVLAWGFIARIIPFLPRAVLAFAADFRGREK